ncbi:MAG: MarR family transcriptional regulator [Chloroflexales bacterium]|nr:MarR family transcriptional regulator [Chloroflexales bacterium]
MQELPTTEFHVVRSQDDVPAQANDAETQVFVIEDSLGYLMNYVAKLFARAHTTCLEQHDVTLGQWAVLLFLWAEDGLTQTELSRHVAIEDATMVRTIDRMERDGLVQRVRNARDRRQLNIFLTDKGRSLRDVLVPCALTVNATALQGFTDEEQHQLAGFLRRIIASLE